MPDFAYLMYRNQKEEQTFHCMYRFLIYAIIFIFTLTGCLSCQQEDNASAQLLKQANALLQTHPKQAHLLLDSIKYPENLDAWQNAQWCMMMGQTAETLHTDLPYSHQLERAARYYHRKGNTSEQARILLYLGRAYVEEMETGKALHIYLKALDKSLSVNNNNLSGYINSYIGDLYNNQASYNIALKKYLSAATYFEKAKNIRSQAFAYRDASRMCYLTDSLEAALNFMKKAETLLISLKDSTDMADILNGFGNIYMAKENYNLAETYFKKGIEYDKEESAPDYLALAQLCLYRKDFDQAQKKLEKAQSSARTNYTYTDCFYLYYKLKKLTGHTNKALAYLEHYIHTKDSLQSDKNQKELADIEERYSHAKAAMTNYKLKKERQQTIYLLICITFCFSFIMIIYQLMLKRKALVLSQKRNDILLLKNEILVLKNNLLNKEEELNKLAHLLEQQKEQANIETVLQQTQIIYQQKQKEIESLNCQLNEKHKKILQEAPIIKRVQKLATQVIPNAAKSPLSKKDWQMIYELINTVYPHIASCCQKALLDEQEEKLCYLSIFELGTSGEAVLLNYTVSTINKYRQNARRKLNINNRNLSLHDFLTNQ